MRNLEHRIASRGKKYFGGWAHFASTRKEIEGYKADLLRNPDVRPLNSSEIAHIADYAKQHFGHAGYAPWLEFYTMFRGEFLEGWIPDDYFQKVAVANVNGFHHRMDSAKSLQRRLLSSESMPDRAYYVSGDWRSLDGSLLARDDVPKLIFGDNDEICVKTERSSKGRGVHFFIRQGFELAMVEALGELVVQSPIRQHPLLAELSPSAVATLRIATGKLHGQRPFFSSAYLRLGRVGQRVVTLGSLRLPIVDATGALGPTASDSAWLRYATHPDTGVRFEGRAVPSYQQMISHCVELHERLPQFGLIAWDVTLDRDGNVQVMELNTGHPGIKFPEVAYGPTLRAFRMEQYARRV